MAAPDEYLWTSSGVPLSAGARVDPARIPVEGDGSDDLDNLRYGSYVDAHRDSRLPGAVGVPSVAVIVLCGWVWAEVGRDDLLATVAVVIPMVIALGAMLAVTRRPSPRLGIQISATEVMLGRWPDRTYRFPRSAVTQVKMSNGPWAGSSTAALPSHDFRKPLHYYLQITVRSGDIFCVAADPIDNPVTDRIVLELKRTAAPLALEPAPSSSNGAESKQSPPLHMPKDQPNRAPKPPPPGDLAAPSSAEKLWETATVKHDEILLAYLPYETEPLILMRYPALTDITHPATARFHEAMEESTALRTETMPSDASFAAAYRDAVRRLSVAWAAAERAAKREGTTYLDPVDRRKIEQAAKLLRHAEGAESPPERAAYLRQVKSIMDELVDNGAIHAPLKIVEAIEAATTRAIEAAAQR
ncbi:hypothetical protein EU244_030640 [Rhodococcus qingshengii]|uniref:hypothetical protein n=1 Tax=Rhodococcus qingshengii TaxID=334542 RepID=UPI0010A5B9C0|nr:hypothetical protein [Rhodococcus qingshengii]THJ65731.1 hypothetical protein EU244_29060 [Rhodococcus qingshengii]